MGMSPWLAVGATVGLLVAVAVMLAGISFGSRLVQRWGDHSVRGPHRRED